MEKILGKIMEWSMRVFGYALLLMTVFAFFAMFWKGLYCLGLAFVSFILSQVCFVNANDAKDMFNKLSNEE